MILCKAKMKRREFVETKKRQGSGIACVSAELLATHNGNGLLAALQAELNTQGKGFLLETWHTNYQTNLVAGFNPSDDFFGVRQLGS